MRVVGAPCTSAYARARARSSVVAPPTAVVGDRTRSRQYVLAGHGRRYVRVQLLPHRPPARAPGRRRNSVLESRPPGSPRRDIGPGGHSPVLNPPTSAVNRAPTRHVPHTECAPRPRATARVSKVDTIFAQSPSRFDTTGRTRVARKNVASARKTHEYIYTRTYIG